MTSFDPAVHGFDLANEFQNYNRLPAGMDFRSGGLCGGMAYAALDYFNARIPIPSQDYRPAEGHFLQQFIYGRQSDSLLSNIDKWTELLSDVGWLRTGEFFNWGLQGTGGGRIEELRSFLDRGVPVPA